MSAVELRRGAVADAIRRYRLIVVLRRVAPREALLELVAELAEAGVHAFEITFDAPSAAADLAAVRGRLAMRSDGPFLVGGGTVLDADSLAAVRGAGADFAVAPTLDRELVATSVAGGLPFVAGAFTPTEVAAAWEAGATFVKLFPAAAVGPGFVRELAGPMPGIELIPTGGINGAAATAFLRAGAVAVGIGGAIVRSDQAVRREIVAAVTAVAAGRGRTG